MKYLKSIFLSLIILLIPFYPSSAEIKDMGEYFRSNVVHKTLPNGINILMLNHGYAPTLALIISFSIGSTNESYETIGAAHMLEHMLFKGTDKIGTSDYKKEKKILDKIEKIGEEITALTLEDPDNKKIEILKKDLKTLQTEQRKYTITTPYSKIYSENGGVGFNAFTSKDMTAYIIELPSSKLELWAELESERLRNPVFREFYIEKDAVIEERLMRYESEGNGALFELFLANAFIVHPYRHPVIGWKSSIENFTVKKISEFYKTNYIPSRMTITVVGKQDVEKTFTLLNKYFAKIENKTEPPETGITEPEQNGERRLKLNFDSNPYLLIGWHKPTFPSKADYIFDIISMILSDGNTSRLYKSLVIEKGIAASIDAYNGYPGSKYDNLFLISAAPKNPATLEELESAIYKEIKKLTEDLSEKEIQKVINKMESSYIFDLDTNMGIARLINYYETNFKKWDYSIDYLNILKTITSQDIKDAIKKYLTERNRTVGMLNRTDQAEK